MHRKKTLRKMAPVSRRLAKLIGEAESVTRKMKNLLPEVQRLEADSKTLKNHRCSDVNGLSGKPLFSVPILLMAEEELCNNNQSK